jgi:hypothetical protein
MNFYSLGQLLFTITQNAALQMHYFHIRAPTLHPTLAWRTFGVLVTPATYNVILILISFIIFTFLFLFNTTDTCGSFA